MTPPRIFHFQFGTDGGTENFFLRLTAAFAERGCPQGFAIRPGRSWKPQLDAIGLVTEGHPLRRTPAGLWQAFCLRRLLRDWRPDVVMAWRAPAARLMPRDPSVVRVLRLGDYPRHGRHLGAVDAVVVNAPQIGPHLDRIGWTGPTRLISNFPPDTDPPAASRAALATPSDAFVICGAGRFFRTKGFDTLVRAAAALPDVWLWLVGDGEERPALEALVEELGLAERTRLVGWVPDILPWIKAADAFVVPSRDEPLGNVLLEGWRAGTPCVTTLAGGLAWIATDGQDALTVPVDDVPAMAAAIARLRDTPGLGAALAARARQTLDERFSKQAIVDAYFALFDQIGSRR